MITTTCCIVGGGPAGMMLGYLLARQGVQVIVLEKHNDFFRDFRGDTVHPSTLQVLHELGILDDFLKVPHQELRSLGAVFGGYPFQVANFRLVPTRCKFIALMPQWDFLNFLASHAKQFPSFQLLLEHEVTGLIQEAGRVTGVTVRTPGGVIQVRADLVVGCDGRHAVTRPAAHFPLEEFGVPIDVLWFRLPRKPDDPDDLFGNINYGRGLILINRGDYFQAGFLIAKGSFDELREQGLDAVRQSVARIAPYMADRVHTIEDWDQLKLLTVQLNRLRQWHMPGLLCIGDAAHAMSPVGGVGINLAIQDAVATANLLAVPLLEGRVTETVLDRIQTRRTFPAVVTQGLQKQAHKGLNRIFQNPGPMRAPWQLKAIVGIPGIQYALGYLVGVGVRPEHIRNESKGRLNSSRVFKTVSVCAGILLAVAVAAKQIKR